MSVKNYCRYGIGRTGPQDKEEQAGMVDFHMIIGLATLAAFIILTIVNGLRAFRGAEMSWARGLSFAAAGLLMRRAGLHDGELHGFCSLQGPKAMKRSLSASASIH